MCFLLIMIVLIANSEKAGDKENKVFSCLIGFIGALQILFNIWNHVESLELVFNFLLIFSSIGANLANNLYTHGKDSVVKDVELF